MATSGSWPLPPRSEACDAVAGYLAAVALDTATPTERLEVQRHVAECVRCALELEQLQESAAYLGLAAPPAEPPAGLKQRVLNAALAERAEGSAARPAALQVLERVRRLPPVVAALAAALVVSFGSLAWAVSLQRQVTALSTQAVAASATASTQAARYDTVVGVLESASLQVRPLAPAMATVAGASGTVYLDPQTGTGMLMVRNMPPVPRNHAWQVWFVRGSERVSGGLVWCDPNGAGYSVLQVPSNVQQFDAINLTEEPGPAGSPWPTTPRVLDASL